MTAQAAVDGGWLDWNSTLLLNKTANNTVGVIVANETEVVLSTSTRFIATSIAGVSVDVGLIQPFKILLRASLKVFFSSWAQKCTILLPA